MGQWYKTWYLTTPAGEAEMRTALADPQSGAANRADINRRLDELKQLSDDRCHVSLDQRRFLQRVLNG